jgi:hypothetical protein
MNVTISDHVVRSGEEIVQEKKRKGELISL